MGEMMVGVIKKVYKFIVPYKLRMELIEFFTFWYPVRFFNTLRYQVKDTFLKITRKDILLKGDNKVSILIPTLSKGKQADHLPKLKKLLSTYLPQQTFNHYEALVYCDGRNEMVEAMVKSLCDDRIKIFYTDNTLAKWGHPQTRMGITLATGEYFVRLNDDNKPYKNYIQSLVSGFDQKIGVVYGRVIYKGDARKAHDSSLMKSFVIPGDREGGLRITNIDCMNYMVKTDLAKKYVEHWNDKFEADWFFIEAMLLDGIKAKFIDRIIGDKY
jgi:cellulose synthase/poly-beta-1,6-N-acetylglucosamine synthase-like glycosyltransferase